MPTTKTLILDDGNAMETYTDLDALVDAANAWHYYMVEQDELTVDQWVALPDVAGETLDEIRDSISTRLDAIAKVLGARPFYGHGNYAVSATDAAGLRLDIEETQAR